ncbi:MAG: heme exporter protein CcmB [Caldilineaceae bacterium]|nr:heme exporter protein CcmB [Caldilineaceae bacterium]
MSAYLSDGEPLPVMQTGGGPKRYLAKVWAITRKELQSEWRAKEVLGTMTVFAVLAIIIFGMAFDLRVPQPEMVAPGVLWVVTLFAGVMGLNRTFGAEADRGSLPALLLAPMDRSAIYFGKLLASLFFMLATEVIMLPILLVIFDVNLMRPWILAALILGTIGYVSVGSLFGALTASARARETMLPILLLPLMVPVFMAGVALTGGVLDGRSFSDFRHWLGILTAYDLIFVTIAFLVFDLIWQEG